MNSSNLTKRVEHLEIIEKKPEPGVIICAPCEVDSFRARYPNALILIDDIAGGEET